MGKYANKVNIRKNEEFGYDEWDWACSVCGTVYEKHSDAAKCCGDKKEWVPGYTYEHLLKINSGKRKE